MSCPPMTVVTYQVCHVLVTYRSTSRAMTLTASLTRPAARKDKRDATPGYGVLLAANGGVKLVRTEHGSPSWAEREAIRFRPSNLIRVIPAKGARVKLWTLTSSMSAAEPPARPARCAPPETD